MKTLHQIEKNPEILLINPPFGNVANPYISIPILTSYLRSRDICVSAYDMKRELFVQLLTPQNILQGLKYAKERFIELNNRPQLKFSEAFEYSTLLQILSEIQSFKTIIQELFSPFAGFSDIQDSRAINFFIRATTSPFFPETIIPDASFSVGYMFSLYSSSDILAASEYRSWYTCLCEQILDEKVLPECHPQLIGFSVVFPSQIIPAFQCARLIKRRLPDVHITMGGPWISVHLREVREKRFFHIVDSFVLDEGEIPLETLAKELSKPSPDLSNVPGLIYPAGDHIHVNLPAPSIDLQQSPPPDYTMFQLDNYLFTRNRMMLPLRLSKGCYWQKCTFCRTSLPFCYDYQQLPMEHAYSQLIHVLENSGVTSFFFSDENSDPKVMEYISKRLLEDHIHIQWMAHTRVSNLLTKQRCELYRQAGCMSLRLGIESCSDRILKLMKKGITARLIKEVLFNIDGVLPLLAYMIVGFPTETEEEALTGYKQLKDFMSNGLLSNYIYNVFEITSGSDIYKNFNRYGISAMSSPEGSDLSPNIIDFMCAGMSREKAYQLAMMFNRTVDENYSLDEVVIDDKMVPLRYDCQGLEKFLCRNSFTDLPFVQWLRSQDETQSLSCNQHINGRS